MTLYISKKYLRLYGTSAAVTTTSATTTETHKTENSTTEKPVTDVPAEITPALEPPVAEESDKYTPDEAIAVYRSILEANGITWDPSIKEFASWGTGFMYLDKGYAEQVAQMDLEAMAYGDGTGNSNTRYYFEVTGYDENCVYTKSWGCN